MREAIKLKFKYQLQEEDKGWAGFPPLLVWREYLFSANMWYEGPTFALFCWDTQQYTAYMRHATCDM